MADQIRTIGIVGTGLIGSGWASRCLAHGISVIAYDPAPTAHSNFASNIENAWKSLSKMGFDRTRAADWQFTDDMKELCGRSDLIQESASENIDLKQKLHTELDLLTDADVIIASSSSGLLPSEIQANAQHPERIAIGHPFNPVYILPLVEIVKGSKTAHSTAQRLSDFYRSIGMYPLIVKKEIEGYISDRIQESVWREALHLVNDGVATTQDIDDAIVYGPGLRWAIMGVCLTFHLAGGEQGMKHMLRQFGPALELPWTHMKAPQLTNELIDRMIDGTEQQSAGRSVAELENLRDDCLIEILEVLKKYSYAAGSIGSEVSCANG